MEVEKMLKKLLYFSIILIISILCFNTCYATNIVTGFENVNNNTQTIDNSIYSTNEDFSQAIDQSIIDNEESAATTTTTDYESEAELSISNMINIVLIAVGVVLILLGIAIIIKLK